ncbi:MAG: fructose PTS transporter subunit IIB [Erysipelothrix sp.]|jgi:PTS system fructose-specific IIC component|nr:fructose PTS transporter subunit IIB [Erysipelothrix sp.]
MKVLGVTACPTGIAHTYMAAEAIEQAAKRLGFEVKVETRGSVGVENELTADDIANADVIVLACDTTVPTERFIGKKVISVGVSDAIKRATEIIETGLTKENFTGTLVNEKTVKKVKEGEEAEEGFFAKLFKKK